MVHDDPDRPDPFWSYPDYEYVRDHNHSFSGVIAAVAAFSTFC